MQKGTPTAHVRAAMLSEFGQMDHDRPADLYLLALHSQPSAVMQNGLTSVRHGPCTSRHGALHQLQ